MDSLTKARNSAHLAADSLRRALADADPVEGLVLLNLVDRAACLVAAINTLIEAKHEAAIY
jgi:hypothetical protein